MRNFVTVTTNKEKEVIVKWHNDDALTGDSSQSITLENESNFLEFCDIFIKAKELYLKQKL